MRNSGITMIAGRGLMLVRQGRPEDGEPQTPGQCDCPAARMIAPWPCKHERSEQSVLNDLDAARRRGPR